MTICTWTHVEWLQFGVILHGCWSNMTFKCVYLSFLFRWSSTVPKCSIFPLVVTLLYKQTKHRLQGLQCQKQRCWIVDIQFDQAPGTSPAEVTYFSTCCTCCIFICYESHCKKRSITVVKSHYWEYFKGHNPDLQGATTCREGWNPSQELQLLEGPG